ncbi:MAG TPA: ComEC/Rec2 family competence protein [Chlamydiales bacterium]|nr:ComEC/Rec2 family competence protein [Chlamydiales bacterium]
MNSLHLFFWRQHPAFLYSLTFLIGVSASLFWTFPWNWVFPLLWGLYLLFLKKWPLLPILPAAALYCHFLYANTPEQGVASGIFSISALQPYQSPFTKGFVYKGTFYTQEGSAPCDIYTQGQTPLKKADRDYYVTGVLFQKEAHYFILKPKEWIPIEKSQSFAELRFQIKERYRRFLSEKCTHPKTGKFLASLTTGDVDDRMLKYEFGRLGLQHLLAISGFHFGVLIAFASFTLSLFLPRFWKYLVLLLSLSAYYFFLGPFPAVQRSWMTAITYVAAKLLNRQTSALNLLGFTLGFELVSNPCIVSNLGFQFSFASTGGILLLHPFFEKTLRLILPKKNKSEVASLPFFSKHFYLLSHFLRHSLALNLSVNTVILPILLCYFHSFPLLSLIYNLFFPCCVGIALSSLLLALSLQCLIPFLASPIFSATSSFTSYLLNLTSYPPLAFDYLILVPYFPGWAIPFCLFSLLLLSIKHQTKN